MIGGSGPHYEERLRDILEREDWEALREFSRVENQLPDDVYQQDRHFWEVLLHKIICNRMDMMSAHAASRAWLERNGYTTDIADY